MKTIPWSNRLQIASDIAEGMAFLHSRGLIHRDLKSLNILLDHTGKAKIADFVVELFCFCFFRSGGFRDCERRDGEDVREIGIEI